MNAPARKSENAEHARRVLERAALDAPGATSPGERYLARVVAAAGLLIVDRLDELRREDRNA